MERERGRKKTEIKREGKRGGGANWVDNIIIVANERAIVVNAIRKQAQCGLLTQ